MLRTDLKVMADLIHDNSRILDLGCGDGQFMAHLVKTKKVRATGIEINQDKIFKNLEKGLNVIHANLDEGLALFEKKMFDFVILNETLQVLQHPIDLLKEMLRVGKQCIVGINNFGHWKIRMDLLLRGRMPSSESLPYEWYNTPNIHLCTLKDFELACHQNGIQIEKRIFFRSIVVPEGGENVMVQNMVIKGGLRRSFYNIASPYGIYLIKSNEV